MNNKINEMKMPIKLTIIGNGFDLAIGAKTTYEAFYNCLKACFQADTIDAFKKPFVYDGNEESLNSFYKLVRNNMDNYFINYFLNYEFVFGNWVSFEKELTRIIKAFDDLVAHLNSQDRLFMDLKMGAFVLTYVRIIGESNLLKVLSVYPNNKYFYVNLNVQDFTKDGGVLFTINGKTFRTIYEVYQGISAFSEEFPTLLYKDLIVFSNLFSLYLEIVNHFANYDLILHDAFGSSIFINYNFTYYLEKIMEENEFHSKNVLYINGLAENINGCPKEKIVFGIDSNTKLANLSFEAFTKRIQRTIKDTEVSRLNYVLNNYFEEVYIFGHSLNIADYESLNFIFSKCEEAMKPRITIYYFDNDAKLDLAINLKTILGNDKFDEYQRDGLINFVLSKNAWTKINK